MSSDMFRFLLFLLKEWVLARLAKFGAIVTSFLRALGGHCRVKTKKVRKQVVVLQTPS